MAKRGLDKQDNDFQDAMTEFRKFYQDMAYYSANILIKSLGDGVFWEIPDDGKANITKFVENALEIAERLTTQLRLPPTRIVETLSPLIYLYKIFNYETRFRDEKIKLTLKTLVQHKDPSERNNYNKFLFDELDSIENFISLSGQDEGIKLALRTGLNSLKIKVVDLNIQDIICRSILREDIYKCALGILHDKTKDIGSKDIDSLFKACEIKINKERINLESALIEEIRRQREELVKSKTAR